MGAAVLPLLWCLGSAHSQEMKMGWVTSLDKTQNTEALRPHVLYITHSPEALATHGMGRPSVGTGVTTL